MGGINHGIKGFSRTPFLFFAFFLSFGLASCGSSGTDLTDPLKLRGGETRPTLSPLNFTGETAKAYAIAKEIPEIIDSLYCYCDCKKHYGHKSLLTCYVDEHAANCKVCMDEAFAAYEMKGKGMDVVAIRKAVDEIFSQRRHSH